jgi:hypothetical protein
MTLDFEILPLEQWKNEAMKGVDALKIDALQVHELQYRILRLIAQVKLQQEMLKMFSDLMDKSLSTVRH